MAVSNAFARSSAACDTSRGSKARIPAKLSGLVSEKHPVSASSTAAFVQPTIAAAANAAAKTALVARSTVIAQADR
jgi:hypothetical protein